ncbi:serine/threonine protein kinase [uncultured Piscinibacter sp.]|uniref:serine/threonine protein kinase n=1 Tax=uncultured Piscinibacter sp. TaxID=1131835 RepID=UPI00260A4821|nr:serine/threonine protein kinase [uncultured Piscinibacter sp.]
MSPRPADTDTPYAGLDPEVVLDALDAVGLRGDGRLIQLNSYENRVFQVFLENGRVVVAKFYRPGRWSDGQILEEHAFAAELEAREIPLAAPWSLAVDPRSLHAPRLTSLGSTLASFASTAGPYRFAVTERMAGRAPEVEDPTVLEWIGRFIGRIHAIGAVGHFAHRLALSPSSFGTEPRDWLLAHDVVPPDARQAWSAMVEAALTRVGTAFAAASPLKTLRLHGDCHLGNILWTSAGPHFVDLDDALTGPAVQDLWMLLSGSRTDRSSQLGAVLDGYEQFMDFDRRELALIEPLRTLRMIHHSAWIARRWKDPAFPIAFPWFESPSYWMEQTTRLREQLEAMDESPLAA